MARLERDSATAPGAYRAKVAALALLGFGILFLMLGAVGFGLLLLVGFAVAVALSGGAAVLLLVLKLGKLLVLLAIPLWYLLKAALRALFVRLPAPQGREITRAEAPALFAALDGMRTQMRGPRFHHVQIVDAVNAAVVQRPAFGLFGWPRNYLLLGLPLLECMPPGEALAVVAHEYGHLAGSHGHFSAFIYRLRHTWAIVQAYTENLQGWLVRGVAPLVRWYAPYFNAYTFVLARSNEYEADSAAAELVGVSNAAHALKRVNVIAPKHQRFMRQILERIDHDAQPPKDLMQRWAAQAAQPPAEADARRWIGDALDHEGDVTDSHPTLRARLAALSCPGEAVEQPPPPLSGESAARAWFGALVERLREEFEGRWSEQVSRPWAERHAEAQKQRERLNELRAMGERDTDRQIEMLRLMVRLEPTSDVRPALAAFNAEHADHALGLFLEGAVRLEKGEREGLGLLDRAMQLDPEATKASCECAHSFLRERNDLEAAEAYAVRWRRRDQLETQRSRQLRTLDARDALVAHALSAETLSALKSRFADGKPAFVRAAYLARRVIPADPSVVQFLVGVELTYWGARSGKQQSVVNGLAALQWPLPLVFVTLDGRLAPLKKRFDGLPDAKLI